MKPPITLRSRVLDVVVAFVSAAGTVLAVFYVDHWHRLATQPDAEGLEMVGVVLGVAYLTFLVPALLCALAGIVTGQRGGMIAGRFLLLAAVAGAPFPLVFLFMLVI